MTIIDFAIEVCFLRDAKMCIIRLKLAHVAYILFDIGHNSIDIPAIYVITEIGSMCSVTMESEQLKIIS